jgi:formylglycine-generating enzyme required for sulfatase activity
MKLGKFTAHILICVSISLSVSGDLIISASAAFAQERRPLSVENVEHLMKEVPSHGRIAQLIQQNGVNFEATAAVRTRLKSAGAGAEVMEAVEKASAAYLKARAAAQPPAPAVDPERAKLEEENRKLREALQKEEARRKQEAERAKLEEQNKKLKEELQREAARRQQAEEERRKVEEERRVAEAKRKEEEERQKAQIRDKDGAEMVSVPAGEFWMGSDDGDADEKPRRRVYLDAFRIDKYEVTNALYRRFIDATGRATPQYWNDSKWNEAQQPVVGVSWNDAQAYCSWAGKRLPTEAEWEKAARGTDGRKYPWGEQWDASRANSDESKIGKTVAVGSYSSGVSPYGAHDLAGNVWEWVADWFDANYYSRAPGRNPKGPGSGERRVLRGGSWFNLPGGLRASGRSLNDPSNRDYRIGFRCAQ